jgi:hypothetical protein
MITTLAAIPESVVAQFHSSPTGQRVRHGVGQNATVVPRPKPTLSTGVRARATQRPARPPLAIESSARIQALKITTQKTIAPRTLAGDRVKRSKRRRSA